MLLIHLRYECPAIISHARWVLRLLLDHVQVITMCCMEPFATQYYLQLSPICNVKAVLIAAVQAVDTSGVGHSVKHTVCLILACNIQMCCLTRQWLGQCLFSSVLSRAGSLIASAASTRCFFSCVLDRFGHLRSRTFPFPLGYGLWSQLRAAALGGSRHDR